MRRPSVADRLRLLALVPFVGATLVHGVLQDEPPAAVGGAWRHWIGALPESYTRGALATLERANVALGAGHIERYRGQLRDAGALLEASLAADPRQPENATQLLALRLELEPATHATLLNEAQQIAEMAAGHARTHLQLGQLLLRAGLADAAIEHLGRAVEARETLAAEAVATLRVELDEVEAVVDALPPSAEVLLCLRAELGAAPASFLPRIEALIEEPAARARLLPVYVDTAIRLGRARSLLPRFERWGPPTDHADRAEWHQQHAAVLAASERHDAALAAAAEAVRLDPDGWRRLRMLAAAELAAGRAEEAVLSARRAARAATDGGVAPRELAALYLQLADAYAASEQPERADAARRRAERLAGAPS